MKKILFYLILLSNTFQVTYSQNKEQVAVEQVPSSYSTILYANSEKEKIEAVRFYLAFDITNNTNEEVNLSFPEYIYNKKYTGNSFKDGYKDIHITIGPAHPERIRAFSGGRKDELILQELIAMMLPINTEKNIKYTVLNEFAKFRLSDTIHKAYLGINTKL